MQDTAPHLELISIASFRILKTSLCNDYLMPLPYNFEFCTRQTVCPSVNVLPGSYLALTCHLSEIKASGRSPLRKKSTAKLVNSTHRRGTVGEGPPNGLRAVMLSLFKNTAGVYQRGWVKGMSRETTNT